MAELQFSREYVAYGACAVSLVDGEPHLTREGIEVDLSGAATSYARRVLNAAEQVTSGILDKKELEKMVRGLDRAVLRSHIYAPTETFYFRAVRWIATEDEHGLPLAIFEHSTIKVGDVEPDVVLSAEPSRPRPINSLDQKRIVTYRLDTTDKSRERIEQVLNIILDALQEESGKQWFVLGNHNEYVVFVERGYTQEIFEKLLCPEVNAILQEEIKHASVSKSIQKPTFGSKVVNICLLAAGEQDRKCDEKIDLRSYQVFHEDHRLGSNDGTFLVLEPSDFWKIAKHFGLKMGMTSGIQVRIPSIVAKGMIALATPWLPAGIYTKGMNVRKPINSGFYAIGEKAPSEVWTPEELRIGDIIILDSTAAHSGKRHVSISSQMAYYAEDEFRQWWEDEAREAVTNLENGELETWSHVYNALAESNPEILLEVGVNGNLPDALLYRVAALEVFGSNWRYVRKPGEERLKRLPLEDREIVSIQGAEDRGIIRALPCPGEYTIVMGSEEISGEPDEDGDYDIILSAPTARAMTYNGIPIKVGDRIHGWRCPILAHRGVAISFKVRMIWTKRRWLESITNEEMNKLLASGFDPENPSHFSIGSVCYVSPKVVLAADGDFDGDRLVLTAKIVHEYEKLVGRPFRPPFITPALREDMDPKKVSDDFDWLNPEDRLWLTIMSQGIISDWNARRWADLFYNPPVRRRAKQKAVVMLPSGQIDVFDLATLKEEDPDSFEAIREEVMAACTMIIRGMVKAKKHPIDIGDAARVIAPEFNSDDYVYTCDAARALESLLSANKGPFAIADDGSIIDHPYLGRLMKDLRSTSSSMSALFEEAIGLFNRIKARFEQDSYAKYIRFGDGTLLSSSRIAFNGAYQKKLREKRWAKLVKGLTMEQISEITGGEITWVNGKMQFRVIGKAKVLTDAPFVPRMALHLLRARMGEITLDGNLIRCFYQEEMDGSLNLTFENGTSMNVDRGRVSYISLQYQHERIQAAEAWIKNALAAETPKFIAKHGISLPTELAAIYPDTETWITTVFEGALLMMLSKVNLARPDTGVKHYNYWTYAAQVVSMSTLRELMSGNPREFEVKEQKMVLCHSALDTI